MADDDCLGCSILLFLIVSSLALIGGAVLVWNAMACASSQSRPAALRILRIASLGAALPTFLLGVAWLLGGVEGEPVLMAVLALAGAGASVTGAEVWREFF